MSIQEIVNNNKIIIMYTTFQPHVISCKSIYDYYLTLIDEYPHINFFIHDVDRSDNDYITLSYPDKETFGFPSEEDQKNNHEVDEEELPNMREPSVYSVPTFVTGNKGKFVRTISGVPEDNGFVTEEKLKNLLENLNNI